jgi:putative redox protein
MSFSNGQHHTAADNTPEKGGQGAGFRPHELLEAALASCTNIRLRMYADNYRIHLVGVRTTVESVN